MLLGMHYFLEFLHFVGGFALIVSFALFLAVIVSPNGVALF
jgi:hypothetical protein